MRWIVDIDEAKALGVAAVPLEIIGQRPVEEAADVGAFAAFAKRKQITVQKINSVGIVYLPVEIDPVIAAQAAFRYIKRKLIAFVEKGVAILHDLRCDRPLEGGAGEAPRARQIDRPPVCTGCDLAAVIRIDADEVRHGVYCVPFFLGDGLYAGAKRPRRHRDTPGFPGWSTALPTGSAAR